ncbi:MAG: Asp23/Gls24 family envelope stress response protein [Actinobacteria bacterium]|uniref:Unannotated protein n=1 Tax=freshwater metagenome TaxID=449393 RepID=A0A6J6NX95_9ZZZZ|nr:Asp23/Gls24 family envelope stress response protein [Actinomycetota bacterium]
MDGQNVISPEVTARYAADAAREVSGVTRIVEGVRKGVRVGSDGVVELHLAFAWGTSLPAVAAEVQSRVTEYLARMADVSVPGVNVIVEELDGRP